MSLKVWLPLNGDLHNQGMLNIVGTNYNSTINAAGKIGSCYYFNGNNMRIEYPHDKTIWKDKEISICMWYKWATGGNESGQCVVDIAADLCLSYKHSSNGLQFGYWRAYSNNGTRAGDGDYASTYYTDTAWHHVVLICNHNFNYIYVDGVLSQTFDKSNKYTVNWEPLLAANYNKITIGKSAGSNPYASGYVNDVRIYDHALSATEIKEISQGLVLHYKLDSLSLNLSNSISCEINNTAYNASIGKYGYNNDSNLSKTTGIFQGKKCVKIATITEGQIAQPYSYFSNLFTSNGANQPAYKKLTFEYYTTCPTTTWLNIYKLGNGTGVVSWKTFNSKGIHSGNYVNSESGHNLLVEPNEWNYIEVILHGDTDANAEWGYCINGPRHTSNADYYFLYANIHLEASNNLRIEDSSGYKYNGTVNDSLIISNDTVRYFSSVYMSQATTITHNRPVFGGIDQEWTCSMWVKLDTINQSNIQINDFNLGNRIVHNVNGQALMYLNAGTNDYYNYSNLTVTANTWTHIAFVFKNSNATKLIYINGINRTNTNGPNKTSTPAGISDTVIVGTNLAGYISDYRIYCTALSANDIKKLYETSMEIDSNGNILPRILSI